MPSLTLRVSIREEKNVLYHSCNIDYFEAGTLLVWDVDPQTETFLSYSHDAPNAPHRFEQGQTANAEPAVANWQIEVQEVFASRTKE